MRLFRRFRPLAGLVTVLVGGVVVAGCSPEHYPQTALLPISEFARIADAVQDQTLYWAIGVFVLVEGALLYAVFRFRGKPTDPEPSQVHGNTAIEIVWTLIPALILAAIAVPTVKGIFKTNETPRGDVIQIEVIGHQWWWEFRYPEYEIVTANQLHIPVGRTVSIKNVSADVIHSFWPPRFAGKRDVFPNRDTRLWFTAEQAGEYPGQCAEFCGIQHARMSFRIMAQEPGDFDAWVAHMRSLGAQPQQAHAASDSLYAAGEKLFTARGCVGCHSLQAHKAPALPGPNLANIGARTWLAAGTLPNTDGNLAKWIMNPQAIKVGVVMPNLGVTEPEARALVAFLRAHQ